MQWTPDMIRAKATAMERRLGRPESTVTRETLTLIVEALRFYAAHGFAERRDGYTVEAWDSRTGTASEEVGHFSILSVAEAVFAATLAARPGIAVTVRKRGWVVRRSSLEDGLDRGSAPPLIAPPSDGRSFEGGDGRGGSQDLAAPPDTGGLR